MTLQGDAGHQLRHTLVRDSEGALEIEPLLLAPERDIVDGLLEAAKRPETRVLGVVDEESHLVGILPVTELVTAVLGRLMPEAFLPDIGDLDAAAEFGHAVRARTVGEAMLPPISISPDATVGEALHLMHKQSLSGLYVVDGDGRPIGYLDLLELAAAAIEPPAATGEPDGRSAETMRVSGSDA
jgi:CBS domain-containing protein